MSIEKLNDINYIVSQIKCVLLNNGIGEFSIYLEKDFLKDNVNTDECPTTIYVVSPNIKDGEISNLNHKLFELKTKYLVQIIDDEEFSIVSKFGLLEVTE